MRIRNIVIFTAALALMIAAFFAMSDNLFSPYVSFREARNSGRHVQIIGSLKKNNPAKQTAEGYGFLVFEGGEEMKVFHGGSKPANFEHSDRVVLIGKYDRGKDIFLADKVLLKCPSKYEKKEKK